LIDMWGERILELIRDKNSRRNLEGEYSKVFKEKFDWGKITQDWIEVVERIG